MTRGFGWRCHFRQGITLLISGETIFPWERCSSSADIWSRRESGFSRPYGMTLRAEALYGIGSVYLNQDKNAAARDTFERCVKLKSAYPDTLPDAWNNLGVLATREGHIEDSIQYFQQALKLSPNHLLTLNNLGNAYRALKQWEQARSMLERALAVSPEDPEANYSLAMVYAATDNTDQAYQHLEKALKARPNYPEALNNLGILYLMT